MPTSSTAATALPGRAYLAAHNVEGVIAAAISNVVKTRPSDPVAAIGRALLAETDSAYGAAVSYIFSNADFSGSSKRYQHPQANWERFEKLLDLLGQPYAKLRVVHIAGTNGKGTTSNDPSLPLLLVSIYPQSLRTAMDPRAAPPQARAGLPDA